MYKQLVEVLGDESLVDTESVNSYKVNDIMPEVIVFPKTVKQVESVIKCAGTMRETIIPWGGGTRIQTGNVQKRYSVALDMRGFNTIKEY